jgi:hypothetical protein
VQNKNGGRIIGEQRSSVAKFIVPDWRHKVDYGIELSYRPPCRQHRLAGRNDNLRDLSGESYAGVNYIPQSGTLNLAIVLT